jgi:hypothetical protein
MAELAYIGKNLSTMKASKRRQGVAALSCRFSLIALIPARETKWLLKNMVETTLFSTLPVPYLHEYAFNY